MKKLLFIYILLLPVIALRGQELRCDIRFNTSKVPGSNKQVFTTLQAAVNEFINGRSWSNYKFANNERIECSMLFDIQKYSGDQFTGTLQIQVRRPVFNSSYNTVLFNYVDNDLDFRYQEYQPLDFSETSHMSNLTSLLAYYAYIILGLDFDSYAMQSGNEFYQKAEKIVNNAQNAAERGWRPGESQGRKNRYWLVNNILNDDYTPVREFLYNYHRTGLDMMYEKIVDGRANIANSLTLLQELYKNRPDPFMHFFQVVLDAKSDEFVNVFQESLEDEKKRVLAILNQIDPSHVDKYRKITAVTK